MAELHNEMTWQLTLTTEEFRLVLKALGDRLSSEPETEAANELGNMLTVYRATRLKEIAKTIEHLEKSMAR